MRKKQVKEIIEKLLKEIEEEDIGISLFSTFYPMERELSFFSEADRERVLKILKKLSEDSRNHKKILEKIIANLEHKRNERRISKDLVDA